MKLFIHISLCLLSAYLYGNNEPSKTYIDTYKHIAIAEMHRTGIPASIKLAQGLLESGAGKSTLATQANNHFGIKCGGSWDGGTFYREDDDHDSDGKLIKSCFRSFSDASESYYAHSNFLTDQNRYAFLFDFSYLDYHAWANGLKKAGYATDKAYPSKLINIIEKYQLYNYDDLAPAGQIIADTEDTKEEVFKKSSNSKPEAKQSTTRGDFDAVASTTTRRTRRSTDSSRKRKTKKKISIFKKKKKRTKRTRPESDSHMVFHVVREGEDLRAIARAHNLDETALRLRNRIPKDAEPLTGEYVYLRKKISVLKRPQFSRVPSDRAIVSQDEYIF